MRNPLYTMRPYLTRSHQLRGLRVSLVDDGPRKPAWEFLDGLAMLGLEGLSLEKFLDNFAPDHKKLVGVIDFEREDFDAKNPKHCAYALRDSVGLYHAMMRAQSILLDQFNQPLTVTMGGACIKIFQSHIPDGVTVWPMDVSATRVCRDYVMRGGFCHCVKRYSGPVWKYDLNQAYAAAMRQSPMPCGRMQYSPRGVDPRAALYIARITAHKPNNKIPFYYRTEIAGRLKSRFDDTHIADTWLTSIEVQQLQAEKWTIKIVESYSWADGFVMRDFVDMLERTRTTCEGGPKGPIGTMVKAVGNHSYGKTVEELDPIEYVLAAECPVGYQPFFGDEFDPIDHVFCRFVDDQKAKDYHAVQIGAFITAAVRMTVRRAALLSPESWLYADTDCVIYSQDMTDRLDVDPKRYGAWKIEETGAHYLIIAKKVYAELSAPEAKPTTRSAKGLNVKKLTGADFSSWYDGAPPVQSQIQRNNFLAVLQGEDMFKTQIRRGTAVERLDNEALFD